MKSNFDRLQLNSEETIPFHRNVWKVTREPSYTMAKQKGKLILVTAMTPTKSGEGKTTSVIALTDALNRLGRTAMATLRQASLGPVFGMKGGAGGGGLASLVPDELINFGLTGDFSKVEAANNLLVALTENHIYQESQPLLNAKQLLLPRCLDVNDRSLRTFFTKNGERKFVITAASEVMAILSLARDHRELEQMVGDIYVAQSQAQSEMRSVDLHFHKAASALLHDALYPNLVTTLEGNPVFLHTGPFANIAQGTCSIRSTALALELADYVVTEAGFGADLGAQKFFDIKCQRGNFSVAASVLVVTTKALVEHGIENALLHLENLKKYGTPVLVLLNRFQTDYDQELSDWKNLFQQNGYECEICDGFARGSEGAFAAAEKILTLAKSTHINSIIPKICSSKEKIEKIAMEIYQAKSVEWSPQAMEKMRAWGERYQHFSVVMAKTPLSLSDNPKLKGVPREHILHVRDLEIKNGARFVIALAGKVELMPGLPKRPRALDY
ncbi:MAG: formate--tetrahydrofolate ligase [Bdellovibrio sp.]